MRAHFDKIFYAHSKRSIFIRKLSKKERKKKKKKKKEITQQYKFPISFFLNLIFFYPVIVLMVLNLTTLIESAYIHLFVYSKTFNIKWILLLCRWKFIVKRFLFVYIQIQHTHTHTHLYSVLQVKIKTRAPSKQSESH